MSTTSINGTKLVVTAEEKNFNPFPATELEIIDANPSEDGRVFYRCEGKGTEGTFTVVIGSGELAKVKNSKLVTVHEDGTITVAPKTLWQRTKRGLILTAA